MTSAPRRVKIKQFWAYRRKTAGCRGTGAGSGRGWTVDPETALCVPVFPVLRSDRGTLARTEPRYASLERRSMSQAKHCLLIVDDEPNVCDSVHDLLRREFRVLKAHSAQEGFRLMQEEEVHIVMSDQRMPQISGVELLTGVKARHPQAIRMLFTGFAELESVIAAVNQGHIFQFVRKPWQPEELLLAVRQAAAEYDRLERTAREREHLLEEIKELKDRLSTLESEVRRLGVIEEPPI